MYFLWIHICPYLEPGAIQLARAADGAADGGADGAADGATDGGADGAADGGVVSNLGSYNLKNKIGNCSYFVVRHKQKHPICNINLKYLNFWTFQFTN